MTPSQRHEQILEKLRLEGQVRVQQLAREFDVTEDCIRKDLAVLTSQKKLQRIHGGAIPIRENLHAHHVDDRLNLREEEKEKIAQKALEKIRPGMTVFLDISSINLVLARLIYQQRLQIRVVTNMSGIMKIFSAPSSAEMIFLGGTLNHALDGFTGCMTIEQICRFHFDVSFLGSAGINLEEDTVSTHDPEDGLTKQAVLSHSKKVYLLSEKEKLFRQGSYHYARPGDFNGWICEENPDEALRLQAKKCHLEIY